MTQRRPYSSQEFETIKSLRAQGWNVNKIAQFIRRDLKRVMLICRELPEPNRDKEIGVIEIPPAVLEDRAKRAELAPRDLTAALCGDPLPGQSALEQRNGR